MAEESIRKFEEAMKADEALRDRYRETLNAVKAEGKVNGETEAAAETATRLGYPITAEELEQARAAARELDDEELDAVAGGVSAFGWEFHCISVYD